MTGMPRRARASQPAEPEKFTTAATFAVWISSTELIRTTV